MAKKRAKWGSKSRKCLACGKSNGARVRKCRHCGGDPRKEGEAQATNGFADTLVLEYRIVDERLASEWSLVQRSKDKLERLQVMLKEDYDIIVTPGVSKGI